MRKEGKKEDLALFATPWFTSKQWVSEMFLILLDRYSDEDEDYLDLKA